MKTAPGKFEYLIRNLFWFVNRPLVTLFMKKPFNFHAEAGSERFPNPPFVLVANHTNFFDPWMVGYQSRHALFIMMNDDGFRGNKFKAWYLRTIGAFPKKKGSHDFKAMKYTLQLLKNGFPVLIFPEGQTSWDGETQPVYSGIEKIIKRAACPLVMVNLHGNFLSRPWWAKHPRKGAIGIKVKVLPVSSLTEMKDEEVLDSLKKYLYNNDVKNPDNLKTSFSGSNLAEGLERFLWICPTCKTEDKLDTKGNTVTCLSCGACWEMDPYMRFRQVNTSSAAIGDLHDWTSWHKQFVKDRLKNIGSGPAITQSPDCTLQTTDPKGAFIDSATGTLELTRDEIRFSGQNATHSWPLVKVEDPVIQLKDIFEFRCGSEHFRFKFIRHSPMKWMFYLRYMRGYEEIEKRGHY